MVPSLNSINREYGNNKKTPNLMKNWDGKSVLTYLIGKQETKYFYCETDMGQQNQIKEYKQLEMDTLFTLTWQNSQQWKQMRHTGNTLSNKARW